MRCLKKIKPSKIFIVVGREQSDCKDPSFARDQKKILFLQLLALTPGSSDAPWGKCLCSTFFESSYIEYWCPNFPPAWQCFKNDFGQLVNWLFTSYGGYCPVYSDIHCTYGNNICSLCIQFLIDCENISFFLFKLIFDL